MKSSLRNISALFRGVDRPIDISNIDKRKLAQKIVYLGQALGLPMNYSFSWYIHGPYSPSLTKDYYDLASLLQAGENFSFDLMPKYTKVARDLAKLLAGRPAKLEEPDWAELLASIVFLRTESNYSWSKAKATIEAKKPQVAPFFDKAKAVLTTLPQFA